MRNLFSFLLIAYFLLCVLFVQSAGLQTGRLSMSCSQHSPQRKFNDSKNSIALKKANEVALRHGFYGAIAGSVQVVSLMWLRTIVNYQYRYGVSAAEAITALYNEGGIGRFYRGMPLAIIQNPLMKFGAVAANEGSKVLVAHFGGKSSPFLTSSLGTIFSILWKFLLVPIETVKTVLQVDGNKGFQNLASEVFGGHLLRLYSGSIAMIISTFLSHYPWFYVHNLLEQKIKKSQHPVGVIARSAFIGFIASVVSDCVSNLLRVVKTLKQSIGDDNAAFLNIFKDIYKNEGIWGLAGRGLPLRIFANGLQSIVFVIVWKLIPLYFQQKPLNNSIASQCDETESDEV